MIKRVGGILRGIHSILFSGDQNKAIMLLQRLEKRAGMVCRFDWPPVDHLQAQIFT